MPLLKCRTNSEAAARMRLSFCKQDDDAGSRPRAQGGQVFLRCAAAAAAMLVLLLWNASVCNAQTAGMAAAASSSLGTSIASSSASQGGISGLTDGPIYPGEVVHVNVFDAPDFSTVARVSEAGDIGLPFLGPVHIAGLTSRTAGTLITQKLLASNMLRDPHILVTVDSTRMGITVLGEVKSPGIYDPPGKRLLSDILAMAGGMTANTGRVIEISNNSNPDKKTLIPWDPTMHNTAIYDRPVMPGERILVKPCGFVYVGGNVNRPGAYEYCGSQDMTLSKIIDAASGMALNSVFHEVFLIRRNPDGTKIVRKIDMGKVLKGKMPDPLVQEDDAVYVPLSRLKMVLTNVPQYLAMFTNSALDVYHP